MNTSHRLFRHTRKSLNFKDSHIPFHPKVSRLLPAKLHTRRFAVTVSFRRILLTLRQLSHGQIIYFYFADASARTSSDTASTSCVCGTQKVWVNLLRINCVSLTNLHTLHGASAEKDPPAGLSLIHSPILDRV